MPLSLHSIFHNGDVPITQFCLLCFFCPQVATLRSAVKLEQEQQFLIAKKLQELTGSKNIKLKPVIDQSLIAGFIVEYGSCQIDLSIRGQIEKVRQYCGFIVEYWGVCLRMSTTAAW